MAVFDQPVLGEPLQKAMPQPDDIRPAHRVRVDQHGSQTVAAERFRPAAAEIARHLADAAGPLADFEVGDLGTGDREHHGHGLAEILVELRADRAAGDRGQIGHRFQPPLQVLPHLLGILHAVEQIDEDHGEILPAQGTDFLHVFAQGHLFLDLPRDLLFDLLGIGAG